MALGARFRLLVSFQIRVAISVAMWRVVVLPICRTSLRYTKLKALHPFTKTYKAVTLSPNSRSLNHPKPQKENLSLFAKEHAQDRRIQSLELAAEAQVGALTMSALLPSVYLRVYTVLKMLRCYSGLCLRQGFAKKSSFKEDVKIYRLFR